MGRIMRWYVACPTCHKIAEVENKGAVLRCDQCDVEMKLVTI